jgi:hypothetical protein
MKQEIITTILETASTQISNTLGRIHETIVAVEKQYILHIGLCVHVGTRTRGCVHAHKCI